MDNQKFQLTNDNYFSPEANQSFLSVSQFKDFSGTYGKQPCEACALAKTKGEVRQEMTIPLLVGSYVDAFFEGTLEQFKKEHQEIFTIKVSETAETISKLPPEYITRNNTIKADKFSEAKKLYPDAFNIQYYLQAPYRQAELIIERILRDKKFMQYMSGEKQKIMTAELFGHPWKIKIDSYHPNAIVDLKIMASIYDLKWIKDIGYLEFIRYWGYEIQGAVYQKVDEIVTGVKKPFYLAVATKSDHPRIELIQIPQIWLDDALSIVEHNSPRIIRIKKGEIIPDRCESEDCDYCCDTYEIDKPISAFDLIGGV